MEMDFEWYVKMVCKKKEGIPTSVLVDAFFLVRLAAHSCENYASSDVRL